MKSDEDELFIKIVALDTIYNSIVEKFFIWKLFWVLKYYFKYSEFEIYNL
jgi:hypothetical protein